MSFKTCICLFQVKPRYQETSKPVIDVFSIGVNLIFQSEVEDEMRDLLIAEMFHPGRVLIWLQVFNDIRKPDR